MDRDAVDGEIVRLAAAGDGRGAIGRMAEAYRTYLRGYVARRLDHPARIDDVCSQVWTALAAAGLPAGLSAPRGWLIGIARHKVADALAERSWTAVDSQLAEHPLFRSSVSTPYTKVARKEEAARVLSAMTALDRDDRELVAMRFLDELRPAEIAVALGGALSAGAISKRIERAVESLRRRLEGPPG
jgi:RNA polymerase sigma-70 factor (ECF subfamily)